MACPVRHFLVFSAVLLGRGAVVAQETAPAVELANTPAAPRRERAVSPRVAALLAASMPKYDGPKPGEAKLATGARDKPANGIVRLPDYIVREPRLPTPEQVMTQKAVEQFAMNQYLDPKDGFDRGLLNAFTIAQWWQKLPLIGHLLPCPIPSMTNEQRAMVYYYEDERLRMKRDFEEMASFPGKAGNSAANDRLRREIQKAFIRD